MTRLILLIFLAGVAWLIRRDTARRTGVSGAVWIPTLWVGILASRPLSSWIGIGGGEGGDDYSIEGSPTDRYFFIVMIFSAIMVLSRRRLNWPRLIASNWAIVIFYAFFFVSVLWADSSIVSFKRWFKDLGNIFVALVILTELNPLQAFRAVFVRCAYLLIPLSIIFIRYFPDLGRRYNIHSGEMEATGVTFQKNSLGALVMVCGMIIIWDWFEREKVRKKGSESWIEKYLPLIIFAMGGWLLLISDSKTSILCLGVGTLIIAGTRLPFVRKYVGSLGRYALVFIIVGFLLDSMFGIKEWILASMGRDMTFTGRTDVWRVLLDLNTDPLFGTGFCSFWSDMSYRSQLPYWVAYSAHNGYLETYLDGGYLGVTFLAIMLIAVAGKINRQLSVAGNYAVVRFAVLLVTILGDFSESHFIRMSPLWFIFLLSALDVPLPDTVPSAQSRTEELPGEPAAYETSKLNPKGAQT